jgi:hypothetical protein
MKKQTKQTKKRAKTKLPVLEKGVKVCLTGEGKRAVRVHHKEGELDALQCRALLHPKSPLVIAERITTSFGPRYRLRGANLDRFTLKPEFLAPAPKRKYGCKNPKVITKHYGRKPAKGEAVTAIGWEADEDDPKPLAKGTLVKLSPKGQAHVKQRVERGVLSKREEDYFTETDATFRVWSAHSTEDGYRYQLSFGDSKSRSSLLFGAYELEAVAGKPSEPFPKGTPVKLSLDGKNYALYMHNRGTISSYEFEYLSGGPGPLTVLKAFTPCSHERGPQYQLAFGEGIACSVLFNASDLQRDNFAEVPKPAIRKGDLVVLTVNGLEAVRDVYGDGMIEYDDITKYTAPGCEFSVERLKESYRERPAGIRLSHRNKEIPCWFSATDVMVVAPLPKAAATATELPTHVYELRCELYPRDTDNRVPAVQWQKYSLEVAPLKTRVAVLEDGDEGDSEGSELLWVTGACDSHFCVAGDTRYVITRICLEK